MWHKLRAWQEQAPRSKRSCVITGWRPLVHLDEGTEKSCLPSPQEGAGLGHGTVQRIAEIFHTQNSQNIQSSQPSILKPVKGTCDNVPSLSDAS